MVYIIVIALLIVGAIVTTSIITAVKNNEGAADIRAKAGVTNTLKLTGIVESIDEAGGTMIVNNVQFSAESRSGKAVNYGTWVVTPPSTFSLSSASPGVNITFTVSSDSFNVADKHVAAAQVTVGK